MNKQWIISLRDFFYNLVNASLSLLRILFHSKFRFQDPLNQLALNSSVILGNGPSLIKAIEDHGLFLKDKLLICVNHFPKTTSYEALKPQVFVTSAPDLWLDNIEPHFVDASNALFKAMAAKTTWPLILLIPFESKKHKRWQQHLKSNEHITIKYYNNTPIEGWTWFTHALFKLNLGMPRPHNVMIPSTFLLINSGVSEIFLLGADHSWLPEISVDDSNQVLINQKHFYDENTSKATTLDKRGKGERKLWELLHKFMQAFKGYFTIKAYAESRKVMIYNATPNSYIDAFERYEISNTKN